MRCPECGLEMMIYQATVTAEGLEQEMVCRNPRCSQFDRRLQRKEEPATAVAQETAPVENDNDSQRDHA